VYLCPEHITKGIVDRHAVPYVWHKNTSKGDKAALTLYNVFGVRTGGIYKRGDEWQRFSQNGDGRYDIPVFNASVNGYELYRVELDNFRDEVLLQLLIDALADFMDGSEYHYKKAQDYVNNLFRQKRYGIADNIASEKVKNLLCDEYNTLHDLERQLRERSSVFTSDVDELEEDVDNNYEDRYNVIEEEIDELRAQISRLESMQSELMHQRDSIKNILREILGTKRKWISTVENEVEAKIEDPLNGYKFHTQDGMRDEIYKRLHKDGFRVREWVNFTEKKGEIFKKAREGAENFEVVFDWKTERTLESRLNDELEHKRKELILDDSISMPELPEEVRNIQDVAKDIEEKIKNVQEGELSDTQAKLFRALCYLFWEDDGFALSRLWETDDLYEFLGRYSD
jgi:hypothetical protein